MPKGITVSANPVAKQVLTSASERRRAFRLPSAIGTGMIATTAVSFALLFSLFHELGTEESLLIASGAALLAGGIAYTIQTFLRTPR